MSDPLQETPDTHGLLILGTQNLFACHLPMFFMTNHCYQAILEIEFDDRDEETYLKIKNENPNKPLIIQNDEKMHALILTARTFQNCPECNFSLSLIHK